eukprot:jgi/Picsp_1/3758/NSC_06593-R1_protein
MGKLKGKKRMTRDMEPRRHSNRSRHAGQDNVADKAVQNVHSLDLDELLNLEILPNKGDLSPAKRSGSHLAGSKHEKHDSIGMREKVADDLDTSDGETSEDESELEMHKEDLERLKETDPEFYKYLRDTDKELLEFDDDEDVSDEMEDNQPLERQDDGMDAELTAASPVIKSEYLSSWCKAAEENASLGAIKYLCRVYRAACHHGDGDDAEESLELVSSAVYNRIMLFMLQKADGIFRKALDMENTDESIDLKTKTRWQKVEPFVKSFLGNTLHLLGKMTDANMLAFILRRARQSVVFLQNFDKFRRKYLALVLKIFASADDEPRVQAILFVRALALRLPASSLDSCLKGVYRAFAGSAKFVTPSSAAQLHFMSSCIVEIYGLNLDATYQYAFVAIKDLALLIRQALANKTKDLYREVYCWQTINCLELWATVLVAYPNELEALFYPLSQLLLCTSSLVPSPSFIPLRLRCIRILNKLAAAKHLYFPVSSSLMEMLQWKDLYRKAHPAGPNTIPDINTRLRVGSSFLQMAPFQEEVIDNIFELLSEHLSLWGHHPSFMEISFVPMLRLRSFLKRTKVDRFRRGARQLCQAIAETQDRILLARNRANFSPKDVDMIARFESELLSQGPTPIIKLRDKIREQVIQRQKMKSLDEVVIYSEEEDLDRPENRKKKTRKGGMDHEAGELTENTTTIEHYQEEADIDDEKDDFEDKLDVYELSDDE